MTDPVDVTSGAGAPVAGAVLVGGASRRMGRPKALIGVDGSPMAVRVAGALSAAGCAPVRLIGAIPNDTGPSDMVLLPDDIAYPIVEDRWPGEGPLGGVITALIDVGGDVVVAACDLPDLDAATVRAIRDARGADRADAVVATTDRLEPALARWNHRALDPLTAIFATGERALHTALGLLDIVEVAVDPAAMRNVNTPGDLGDGTPSRSRR
ncbi:MAG TPA: molybdenum cofactor guanylyltransferase [Ilumatobacteraceae bacterium]|nr:molybdenum cofactor guanylyltransferase [Ilumatobacteraceae bacterium]